MKLPALRERLRSRTVRIGLVVVLVLAIGGIVLGAVAASSVSTRAQFVTGTPEGATPVRLDTTLYLPDSTPAPAILLSQGFGGSKTGLDSEAKAFAQDGYVVLTYSARGFGRSGGLIHFASPDYEIADAKKLVTFLAAQPEVKKDAKGAQIAAAGSSYGGGLSLLLAAADSRVRAVSADITWNDLTHAFFPNGAGSSPGVFKKLWLGQLFGNAFSSGRNVLSSLAGGSAQRSIPTAGGPSSVSCGRFAPSVCAAYQESAATGTPSPAMLALMRQASPATVIPGSKMPPTQLVQGEQDSLFPLSEADANARAIAATGSPVSVVWRQGGHDAGGGGTTDVINAGADWFGKVFGGSVSRPQPFQYSEQAGIVSVETGSATEQTRRADGYPGIDGVPRRTTTVDVSGPPQEISAPAGGVPAAITSIPGLGGISDRFNNALTLLPSSPGQTAYFSSSALTNAVSIVGAPNVRITVTPKSDGDAVLFAGLRDLSDDGTATLPSQLVTPLRLPNLRAGVARTVTIQLPSVVRNVLTKHRLVLTVATTDFAYSVPQKATMYTIALAGGTAAVTVPTVTGSPISAGHPLAWLIVGLLALLLVIGVVGGIIVRRRLVLKRVPELANTPISIEGLVKEYAGGYRAVDHVSFRVEHGQVVGLLGPNGAGKTTALRVLVGLITPTEGQVHVFGEPVVPGAPVLSRLGAFIEGPGFLPHLSGRDNLRLYWATTGRPIEEAEFETALDIAGLGGSIERKVKTYSHGMKQRLGIAQAMLGLPEVLVLDEPTNGLDPPQIAEMREVLQQYARTGRTVVVSSHLLAEVEQTCTHVVVMHKGRLVASGSVGEIAGAGGMQLAVADPAEAARVLAEVGIGSELVPARRALEDVFLEMIGADE